MDRERDAGERGLRLRLLGGFQAWVDGREVADERWRLRRARDLVALLAIARSNRLHREEAIDQLWPTGSTSSPLNSLHQVMHVARRALNVDGGPNRFLVLQGDFLTLAASGEAVHVDLAELEEALAAAQRDPSADTVARAAELNTGELLPERRYENWALLRREAVNAAVEKVLGGLQGGIAGAALSTSTADAPEAARLVATPQHNLPTFLNSFVGRADQLADLGALLDRTRLLTLSGPGGAGKTRLACELARRHPDRYPEGVWFVDLGAISQASLVLSAVAEALGVRPRAGDTLLTAVIARLEQGSSLLFLDNCEHLLAACAEYAETLLHRCPSLTVLATSREPLRLAGETVWRTPSLLLPPPAAGASEVEAFEAVRLLLDRACAVDPGFGLAESNAADIGHLCRVLDGLPLAIELAAARLGALTPRQLAQRLDARFQLLSAGSRTAMTRQQTLAATLDWSHDLLDAPQRAVLRRLSVFAGGFDLEAAEAVCAAGSVAPSEVATVVAELVEKSLVAVEAIGGGRRHRLLETIRQYGRGRLGEEGELEATARRHATWCLALAERAEPELSGPEEPAWLRRLEREGDNLRAALGWFLDREPELVGRLAAALGRFWLRRLRLAEGIGWLDGAIQRNPEPTLLRSRLVLARGSIEMRRSANTTSGMLPRLTEEAAFAGAAGDHVLEARCLLLVADSDLLWSPGRPCTREGFTEVLALGRRHGLPEVEAVATACLGVLHAVLGDDDEAEARLQDALVQLERLQRPPGTHQAAVSGLITIGEVVSRRRELGGRVRCVLEETYAPLRDLTVAQAVSQVTAQLGVLARLRGDLDEADRRLRASHDLSVRIRDGRGVAESLARGGNLALVTGDLAAARRRLRAAFRLFRHGGDARAEGMAMATLGCVALAGGDLSTAVRLHDAAVTHFSRAGDQPGCWVALGHRGDTALLAGDLNTAEHSYRNMWAVHDRAMPWSDFCLADVAEARGEVHEARRLLLGARTGLEHRNGRRAAEACEARLKDLAVPIRAE